MIKYFLVVLLLICILGSNHDPPRDWYIPVTATVYHAVAAQTDDTPHILADGTIIDVNRAGAYRYVGLSRDLFKVFAFGDTVRVDNAGEFDGLWVVRDKMNRRWKRRIDFLVDQDVHVMYHNVQLRRM